jgi:hypothetical protein
MVADALIGRPKGSDGAVVQPLLLQIPMGAVPHPPEPLQVVVQLAIEQKPWGSCAMGTLEQTPTVPARLHALQPPQDALQQTPSAQWPFVHWRSALQTLPSESFATQALPLQ